MWRIKKQLMKSRIQNLRLQRLSLFDKHLILLYVLWVKLRRPALPRPVHFGVVASLATFAVLPLFPVHPVAMPASVGAGVCVAFGLEWFTHAVGDLWSVKKK